MASEKRNLNALDITDGSSTWSNASNAYTEDDNYADGTDFGAADLYLGGNFQNTSGTPTSLDDFKVRFFDINSEHSDDTYQIQVYNPDTTSWEALETFDSGNLLPTSLTTKDYTSAMQSKFSAATDKQAFLDGLQIRFYQTAKSKGGDNINIGLAWANFTHTYSAGPLFVSPSPVDSVAGKVEPTVVLGSVSITPTSASSVSSVVAPNVKIDTYITPAAASSVSAVVEPDISVHYGATPFIEGSIYDSNLNASGWLADVGNNILATGLSSSSVLSFDFTTISSPTKRDDVVDATNLAGSEFIENIDGVHALNTAINSHTVNSILISDLDNLSVVDPVKNGPTEDGYLTGAAGALAVTNIWGRKRVAFVCAYQNSRITALDISDMTNKSIITSFSDATNLNGPITLMYHPAGYLIVGCRWGHMVTILNIQTTDTISYQTKLTDASYIGEVGGISKIEKGMIYIPSRNLNCVALVDVLTPTSPTLTHHVVDSEILKYVYCCEAIGRYCFATARNGYGIVKINVANKYSAYIEEYIHSKRYLDGPDDVQGIRGRIFVSVTMGRRVTAANFPSLTFIKPSPASVIASVNNPSVSISAMPSYQTTTLLKPARGNRINKSHPLARGLKALWLFNQGTGKVYDSLSGKFTVEPYGSSSTPWTQGKFGHGIESSMSNVSCLRPASQKSPVSNLPATILAWVKVNDNTQDSWFVHMAANLGSSAHYYSLGISDTSDKKFYSAVRDTNAQIVKSTTVAQNGKWYQVVTTCNSQNGTGYNPGNKIYVNGKYENVNTNGRNPVGIAQTELCALTRASIHFEGIIDHIAVWDRELSPEEIAGLFIDPFQIFERDISRPLIMSVPGNVIVTPSPATVVASKADPSVILGSLSLSPAPASAIAGKSEPTVQEGNLLITPSAATAIAGKADPTVIKGSVSITPSAASAVSSKADPTVIVPSVTGGESTAFMKPMRMIQLNKTHIMARDIAGCWLMNEGTGNKVTDSSGNRNDGTNPLSWVAGKYGSALLGSTDYVTIADDDTLEPSSKGLTVLAWIYIDSWINGAEIVDKRGGQSSNYYQLKCKNSGGNTGFQFITHDGSNLRIAEYDPGGILPTGWYQVVGVFDPNDASSGTRVYANAVLGNDTDPAGTTAWFNSEPVLIGDDNIDQIIDHVMIWNRALSASEIASLYREPFQMFEHRTSQALFSYVPAGGVTISPSAASAVAGKVEPSVVKGSIALSPAAASSVSSKVEPTIILGGLTLAPTEATTVATSINPTIINDVTLTPVPASAVCSSADPTVINNVVFSPAAASAVSSTVSPNVVYGSLTVTPSASDSVANTVNPTVIKGSVSVAPVASGAVGTSVSPTVVYGSVSITPAASSAVAGKADPVVINNVILTPDASSAVSSTINPSVVYGSLVVTPAASDAVASGLDPTVQVGGALIISPEAISAVAASIAPTVIYGSVTVSPVSSAAIAETISPQVVYGSLSITPAAGAAVGSVVNPSFVAGSLNITPPALSAIGTIANPSIIYSSTTASPGPAVCVSSGVNPIVLGGTLAFFYQRLFMRRY